MGTTPSTENRRSERRPRKTEVTLIGKSGGFEYQEPAHTFDFSDHGIGIVTDNAIDLSRPMGKGQIVYVLGGSEQVLGYCRVVWTRSDHQQAPTRAGLRFLD
jgi:c-di-GMP-binding flagellar brake protein YcgR